MTDFREVTPLSGEPVRSGSQFLPDVVKMRDAALERRELLLTRVQIEELTKSIEKGETWIAENRGKVSLATQEKAKARLLDLKVQRAKVIYENELPFVALDAVTDLLQRTTTLGAARPEGTGAYIRVVIPGVTTFEADLVLPDIPF